MMKSMILVAALLPLLLTSCATVDLNKGQQGAIGGGAGGALIGQAIGRDTEATLIGAAVGTMLGYIVGNEMDKFDKRQLNQAYEFTPSGQTTSWQNPDNGNAYRVTPQPAYTSPASSQRPCRQAEIEAVIDGRREITHTTACRNDAGQWVLRN